jgi:ADP-ribosylation factor GTPase-activating protein 2/3
MQQPLSEAERDSIMEKLRNIPDNNKCFDCEKKSPKWASVYFGIFLCLDCSGKHREYGPQISFTRSLTLDSWTARQIAFLEHGGNAKTQEYFNKYGLKRPYDYKSQTAQKYKNDLIKKIDTLLNANAQTISTPTNKEEPKDISIQKSQSEEVKKEEDKKLIPVEKTPSDPFANAAVINPTQIKAKGFTVEFASNKTGFSNQKKGLAAKKIDNFDVDSLTLEEDIAKTKSTDLFGMNTPSFNLTSNSSSNTNSNGNSEPIKEIVTKTNYSSQSEPSGEDKLKKFSNAKAISSDAFRDKSASEPATNIGKFSGARSISSNQYFGNQEEEQSGPDYYEAVENARDLLTQWGGKLKGKAKDLIEKFSNA